MFSFTRETIRFFHFVPQISIRLYGVFGMYNNYIWLKLQILKKYV